MLEWISLQPNVRGIAWGEIMVRKEDLRPHIPARARYSHHLNLNLFYENRATVNGIVKSASAGSIRVISHSRFEQRQGNGLAPDGVHIKDTSMKHYWWSVRAHATTEIIITG